MGGPIYLFRIQYLFPIKAYDMQRSLLYYPGLEVKVYRTGGEYTFPGSWLNTLMEYLVHR